MILLKNLTNDAKQSMVLSGENGEQISFELIYSSSQELWQFNLSYQDFTVNGITLVTSPNILYKFKNFLSFGIAVISEDGFDPYYINDFLTNRIKLYLLDSNDVAVLNTLFEGTYEAQ